MFHNPTRGKCVHVVAIDNWRPDVCEITIPNLQQYAKNIGADFNLISKSRFDGYPPNYERFQIYETGKDYQWNINIDADTIMHPDAEDPTSWILPDEFCALWGISADFYFVHNRYFMRDGRNQGISDNFTVSSWLTHDVWEPLSVPYEEAKKYCVKDTRQVSEYQLSSNLAKYGIKFNGALKDHSKHYSLMVTTHKVGAEAADLFTAKLREWGV